MAEGWECQAKEFALYPKGHVELSVHVDESSGANTSVALSAKSGAGEGAEEIRNEKVFHQGQGPPCSPAFLWVRAPSPPRKVMISNP